ncbi:MAG: hypothetical protein ACO1TE_19795 [Prosthecobacter sp.]
MNAVLRSLPLLVFASLVLMWDTPAFAGPLHERWDYESDVALADGSTLKVRKSGSQRRYFGIGHGMGFGGGHLKQKLEFSKDGQKFVWEGGYTPILLQFDGATPLVVAFDRESDDLTRRGLRYFRRADGTWKELPLNQFPRRLAHQNLWLHHHHGWVDGVELDEYDIVKRHDPEDVHFRRSLMAKVWFCIATGKTYEESGKKDITAEFLREFKASMGR